MMGQGGDNQERECTSTEAALEAAGYHCIVQYLETDKQGVYRGIEDGGIPQMPTVMVPILQANINRVVGKVKGYSRSR